YGGGGIMPDYFVPLDTSNSSKYFNELFAANTIREFAFNYAEENKAHLEKMGYDEFEKKFSVDDALLSQLVALGQKEKVRPDLKDLARNKGVFQGYLKAEIARRVWGNPAFYPIFNETNEVLQQAIKMFDRIPELNRSKM
ncbi:MAG TPA: hypothetical protein VKQ08_01030, partial [Cyclobacteriaceae bacterium]|nr:hypothetical protein [Cyclobacteriaceae bacterium]